jgi:formate dehydrogenase alpha subunit
MKIIIDGKEIEAEGKKTILEVARENDIFIPSLCDHPQLAPFTGCRLCIVEVKGKKGFPPSCGTLVEEGMEVKTKTPKIQKLRREILELILTEHPNACLICSEKDNCDEYKSTIRKVGEVTGCVLCSNNGRCELQDVVNALKIDSVRYPSVYRNFDIKKNDPFFDRNYNLCILCGRCVRMCHEVRGASVVSFAYRGTQAVVGTALDRPLIESGCQFCGACVDVCPTGALSERAIKYDLLPDEKAFTICPLCSIGCELEIELKGGKILRSLPSKQGATNKGQGCVKGRFTIRDVIYSQKRILRPLIRMNKELEEASWEEALDFAAKRLKKYKGKKAALITSSQVSCEESYLFQKFAREVLRTESSASLARFSPLAAYLEAAEKRGFEPDLNFKVEDISKAKTIFLFGENLPVSHPIIWLEVLKAVRTGAKLIVISPEESILDRFSNLWLRVKPGAIFHLLNYISKILLDKGYEFARLEGFQSFKRNLDKLNLSEVSEVTGVKEEDLREASRLLLEEAPAAFLFGIGLTQSPSGDQNISALWNLACLTQAQIFSLGLENNLRGILEIEYRARGKGLNFNQIVRAASTGDIKALYLAGPFPHFEKANLDFLIIQGCFLTQNMRNADVVFPSTTFAETDGTFVNAEGRIQKFNKVIEPYGEAKPDWWIISKLAKKMGNRGFNHKNPSGIMREMGKTVLGFKGISYSKLEKNKDVFIQERKKKKKKFIPLKNSHPPIETSKKYPFLMRVDYNLDYYRNLFLSQEIRGLGKIRDPRWIEISPEDAKNLKLKDEDAAVIESPAGKFKGIAKVGEAVPNGTVKVNLFWSEISSVFLGERALGILPVKIKRGK